MEKAIFRCDRCGTSFSKDVESPHDRIRKIMDTSVQARYGDIRVNNSYYLCKPCSAAFRKWITTPPKRKEKKDD